MIRTLLVDVKQAARDELRDKLDDDDRIDVVAGCGNGEDAVACIREYRPDLLFLEVELPGVDGFEVVRRHGVEPGPVVIFLSDCERYAVEAFGVRAVDYLLRPFSESRLRQAVGRAAREIERARVIRRLRNRKYVRRIPVKKSGSVVLVDVDDVDWIEAADNYVCLHVGNRTHLFRCTMSEMEENLDPSRFMRIHRSRIVNVDRVREIHPQSSGDSVIVLRNGARLTSSRTYGGKRRRLLSGLSA